MPSRILERIRTTACDLFSRSGYAGTSTMTIAKAADVTEGSIFRLFGNKAGLWKRCLSQRVAESFSAEAFARSLKGESFEERIRKGIAHLWKTPKSADVRLVNYAMLETPDLARETYSREINVINATIAEMIETERKTVASVPTLKQTQPRKCSSSPSSVSGFSPLAISRNQVRSDRFAPTARFSIDSWTCGFRGSRNELEASCARGK